MFVVTFLFSVCSCQVEHHFGNDLKHLDHQDDLSQYDAEHCLVISFSTSCSPSALVRLGLAAWLWATLLLVRSLSRSFHFHHNWLSPGLSLILVFSLFQAIFSKPLLIMAFTFCPPVVSNRQLLN